MNIKQTLEIPVSNQDFDDREKRNSLMKNIIKSVCALLNSGGGVLKFTLQSIIHQDKIIRIAEEKFRDILNTRSILQTFKLVRVEPDQLTLNIPASSCLITVRYNIFLPTETQVLEVRPIERRSEVSNILERKGYQVNEDEEPAEFIKGREIGLQESQTVQFKNLKTEKTNGSTFSTRVIQNKFTHYVSAFANHRGGRIYYGINDQGVVEGEEIYEEEKVRVKKEIKKNIMKMKWRHGEPQEGVNWKVSFRPVTDETGEPLTPSKSVMIVFVPPYLGGVFTVEPESYHIDNVPSETGTVAMPKVLTFSDWLVYFKLQRLPWLLIVRPLVSSRVSWSSPQQREIYLDFTKWLVRCRNDNNIKGFDVLKRLANDKRFRETGAPVVMAEEVAVEYKRQQFDKAHTLLKRFKRATKKSTNNNQFHVVKARYLESRIERAEGRYKKSYRTATTVCWQEMQKIPAEFITVWFYMHLSMLANILGVKENDPTKFDEAQLCLNLASRDASALDEFPTGFPDLYQKLHIYRAMTLLGCSLVGEIAKESVELKDVEAAVEELSKAYKCIMKGELMTRYREIQFLLAQCSVYLRHSQLRKEKKQSLEYLKRALTWAKQAENLACECEFRDMRGYATKFQQIINEMYRKKSAIVANWWNFSNIKRRIIFFISYCIFGLNYNGTL